ncbi:hypothetical protein SELMODRAFT_171388 [Selaginella moellendorffii]|uniref:C2 domain-containing protein n=1 Tax=Selaginella moellendorffii TaxID=88036 RepID=D8RGQ7_SELML|nr:hypothetical protein SELMODRAFT_171388 [Selaginella moellendorffii]
MIATKAIGDKVVTFDLVERMQYLFVRVVKARALASKDAAIDPFAKISLGSHTARTRSVPSTLYPEWNEVFAFGKERMGGPALEIAVSDDRDPDSSFLGSVVFEFAEIPVRVPPDSPLAPQWYRLERKSHHSQSSPRTVRGDIMLAVWLGTQADEAFTEAWQSDSGGYAHTRSKVYLSPKLWYLRVNVIEAQEVHLERFQPEVTVRAHLGFQVQRTRVASNRTTSPFWNEDLLFVAAEPFEDDLVLRVEERKSGGEKEEHALLGLVRIALSGVERRIDHRQVSSRWYNLEKHSGGGDGSEDEQKKHSFHGRLHLRVCLDGGYHVLDEPVNHLSCANPTARQLWKAGVGMLELGIIRGKDVLPMKNKEGRGSTDAYVVAKYGSKWVRTRTVMDSLNPRWNEQYRWDVHDPCTVLTIGVFDNAQLANRDARIGKVRIRLSTLESDRVYTNRYPLLSLQQSGVKKLGEVELAVRFTSASVLSMLQLYFQPLLPRMHYLHPLGVTQAEILRISAMRIVAIRLARSEPPLRQEVVQYMLDTDVNVWSLRRSKVNYFRLMSVLNGPMAVVRWMENICHWRNPVTTVLVHILFLILVWYPELILPTLFLYMFLIGLWQYRSRPRSPPSMEARLSQAEVVEPDELDEEFDPIPSAKDPNVIRARYDRVRIVAARIQNVLGDLATQGERVGALLSWRDPRATAIFVTFSLVVAVVLYVVPIRVIVVVAGLYAMRHPRFRDPLPAAPINFFRRLPSLADRIL